VLQEGLADSQTTADNIIERVQRLN